MFEHCDFCGHNDPDDWECYNCGHDKRQPTIGGYDPELDEG